MGNFNCASTCLRCFCLLIIHGIYVSKGHQWFFFVFFLKLVNMSPVINTNVVWTELAWENYFLLGMFVIDFSLLIGGWWGRGGMQPDCDLLPIKGTFVSQLTAPFSSLIPPVVNDPTQNAPAGMFLRIPSHPSAVFPPGRMCRWDPWLETPVFHVTECLVCSVTSDPCGGGRGHPGSFCSSGNRCSCSLATVQ